MQGRESGTYVPAVHRGLVSAFILVYLALHSWAVVRGIEHYPLTSALMFSRDIGADRPLYTMQWHVTDTAGERTEVNPFSLRLHPRHFFLHVFLPAHADSPYHHKRRQPDTPEDYDERMRLWFGVLAGRWAEKSGATPRQIVLTLTPYGATEGEPVTLGEYDVSAQRFVATRFDGAGWQGGTP